METVRTPDEHFEALPAFPFAPRYVTVDDGEGGRLRVHHLDEGDPAAPAVLLLHGEPSWSFLYRHMIPVLVDAGLRAVAIDLVGFGRSDKPTSRDDYTYARHVAWVREALDAIGLSDVTLFGQDWGGLIGLRLVAEQPRRFARVVAANTFLPTGDQTLPEAFFAWRDFSQTADPFPVGRIVDAGCTTELGDDVIAGYDAPFPDERHLAGARQFPMLVPASPDDPATPANRAAWEVLRRWDRPFLTAFSDSDPITAGGDTVLRAEIPGAVGQPHTTIGGGGHFLQEDRGAEAAAVVAEFVRSS